MGLIGVNNSYRCPWLQVSSQEALEASQRYAKEKVRRGFFKRWVSMSWKHAPSPAPQAGFWAALGFSVITVYFFVQGIFVGISSGATGTAAERVRLRLRAVRWALPPPTAVAAAPLSCTQLS